MQAMIQEQPAAMKRQATNDSISFLKYIADSAAGGSRIPSMASLNNNSNPQLQNMNLAPSSSSPSYVRIDKTNSDQR